MRKFSVLLAVALTTFMIGVALAGLWILRRIPSLENPITSSGPPCRPDSTQKTDQFKVGEEGYFPEGAFFQNAQQDRSIRNWYARTLKQMNEPPLPGVQESQQTNTYRFLWLRSFHSKIAVRVWSDGDTRTLSVKELSLTKQNESGQLIADQTRSLSEGEWNEFLKLLNATCLWSLPSGKPNAVAMDGAWWVLEGKSEGHYHVVARQSPDPSYRELCLYMLKLSGLKLDASTIEIY